MSTSEPLLSRPTSPQDPAPNANFAFRVTAAMLCFMVQGLFASSTGALIPQLEEYYHLKDDRISVLFLAMPIGYALASRLTSPIQMRFGQRGITFLGPLLQSISALGSAFHPSFPAFAVFAIPAAFGTGLVDASLCAWAAALEKSNVISGLLHGAYSLGAAIGPPLAGTVVGPLGQPWYIWYRVMFVISICEFVVATIAFRTETAAKTRKQVYETNEIVTNHGPSVFGKPGLWLCAAFMLVYVGVETSISGWIVVYMKRIHDSSILLSTAASSGFWVGMLIGRVSLGPATEKMGVRRGNTLYILSAVVATLLLMIANGPAWSIFIISLLGVFCGPLCPSCMIQLTSLLPRQWHVAGVSFVVLIGQVGGALFPFGLGILSEILGIQVFKLLISVQLLLALGVWVLVSRQRSVSEESVAFHRD
ncbi:MFS transporter [Fusarium austroafricanum]|uniref:MFS transporter n=1 Tax=Fusarium austroafricanum TaxID=2364996 RepID=A0A8H4NSN5_9HYPO|nr:MFS transporter [Fusarium austroafricanum]